MFKSEKHKIGRFDAIRLINASTNEYLEVLTEFGAGINDFVVKNKKGQLTSIMDGYRTEQEVLNDHHVFFKGSKLSPSPNRIHGGNYTFADKKYRLQINELNAYNSLHAFLHNRPFELIEQIANEEEASLKLFHSYKGTEKGYPFPYDLQLTYQLKADEIRIHTTITNAGPEEIPMADGWHPYFSFSDVNKVKMQIGQARRVTSNRGNRLNGQHGFEQLEVIGQTDFDDCFELNTKDNHRLRLYDGSSDIEIEWWQESAAGKYRYLQIYTPPSRKSIAIEPVSCAPDAFNNGQGLIILKPNEEVSMSFGIKNLL